MTSDNYKKYCLNCKHEYIPDKTQNHIFAAEKIPTCAKSQSFHYDMKCDYYNELTCKWFEPKETKTI